jgi:hypothetical protein
MKRSKLWLKSILIVLALLLSGASSANATSQNLHRDQHQANPHPQPQSIQKQEPNIPVWEQSNVALTEALHANEQQSIAAQKQADAQKQTFDSPSVVVNEILAAIGVGYLVFMGLQSAAIRQSTNIAARTMLLQFRPRLIVRHVGLLTEPDNMLVPGEKGFLQAVPIDVVLMVSNQGGTQAEVIDGNITLRVLVGDTIQRDATPLLPPFDRHSGLPVYGKEGLVLSERIIKAGEQRIVKQTMPVPNTSAEAVRAYLATHGKRHVDYMVLLAFAYFRYRDRAGRSYVTAFCRQYSREAQRFIAVDAPDYEYVD